MDPGLRRAIGSDSTDQPSNVPSVTCAVCDSPSRVNVTSASAPPGECAHLCGEVGLVGDRNAVELGHDITGLEARGLGRAARATPRR